MQAWSSLVPVGSYRRALGYASCSTGAHDAANSRPFPAPSGCPPPSPGSSWSCQPGRAHHPALRRGRGWCRRAPAPLRSPQRLQVDCQAAADWGTRVLNGAMRRQGNTRPCRPAPEQHFAGTVQKQAPEITARTCGGGQVRLARLGPVGDAGGAAAAPLCTGSERGSSWCSRLGDAMQMVVGSISMASWFKRYGAASAGTRSPLRANSLRANGLGEQGQGNTTNACAHVCLCRAHRGPQHYQPRCKCKGDRVDCAVWQKRHCKPKHRRAGRHAPMDPHAVPWHADAPQRVACTQRGCGACAAALSLCKIGTV